MDENISKPQSQIFKTVFLSLCIVDAAALLVLILVFRQPEWHPQLVRFTDRVWRTFITYNAGSTSPGFISSILFSILGVAIVALYIAFSKGLKAMRDHVIESTAMAILGLATMAFAIYGTQFAWEVAHCGYEDHRNLVSENRNLKSGAANLVDPTGRDEEIASLKKQLAASESELSARKQAPSVNDPAFQNIDRVLSAFQSYRITQGGKPCVVWITAPPDSNAIATFVATLSNSVSGCFTFGPFGRGNPDDDEEADGGMKSGMILVHAPRAYAPADGVARFLDQVIPVQRNYLALSTTFDHYQNQGKMGEQVLWLQFGSKVRWRSEDATSSSPE